MKIGAAIIAGGTSPSGYPLRPFELSGSLSVVQRLVKTFQNIDSIQIAVAVQPPNLQKMEKHLAHSEVVCLAPEKAEQSSRLDLLTLALNYLAPKCDKVFVISVDTPFVMSETVSAILNAKCTPVRPVFEGEIGSPLLLDVQQIADFLAQEADSSACTTLIDMELSVTDEGVLACAPATLRYERMTERIRAQRMYPSIKLSLHREKRFFGPGVALLLELIEAHESVRLACQQMGLSYSKGWKMITVMEKELGIPIVNRQQGGKNGGDASLTKEGKLLLTKFRTLEARCLDFMEQAFNDIFV